MPPSVDELFQQYGQNINNTKSISDEEELVKVITELANDASALVKMRKAAIGWHKLNRGTSERIAMRIKESILKN